MEIKKEILRRFASKQYSINDYLSVKNYFANDKFTESLKNEVKADWDEIRLRYSGKKQLGHVLNAIHYNMNANSKKSLAFNKLYRWFSKVAAVLFVFALIAFGIFGYPLLKNKQVVESWAEIHCPAGARTRFQLPDGSKGWLNSGSSIKYSTDFSNQRLVEISGEVWFDVLHNRNNDFRVVTPHFNVKVLGTQISVTAYNDEQNAYVVLDEGKVQVLDSDHEIITAIVPNQRLVYNKTSQKFSKQNFDAKAYNSWKDGLLIFKNRPLSEIAQRVGRKYNANIIVHGKELNETIFRATFEDEGLEEILKLLADVAPINYKVHKRMQESDNQLSGVRVEIWKKTK
jgi:ferric-dicitrate binding protein FerR (iron transport regulator)